MLCLAGSDCSIISCITGIDQAFIYRRNTGLSLKIQCWVLWVVMSCSLGKLRKFRRNTLHMFYDKRIFHPQDEDSKCLRNIVANLSIVISVTTKKNGVCFSETQTLIFHMPLFLFLR